MLFFGAVLLAAVAVPVLASPIVAFNKRSTGLSVELSTVSGTEVKAVLTNTGGESLTLLNFGSFMDANPVQKVAVYKDDAEVPFTGILSRYLTTGLDTDVFTTLAPSDSFETVINIAALHAVQGGDYKVFSAGAIPFAEANSTQLVGSIAYESNTLDVSLDSDEVIQTANLIPTLDKRTILTSCSGSQNTALRNALTNARSLATTAANAAASGSASKFSEYFKSTASSTRNTVAARFRAVANEASTTTSGNTRHYCGDPYGYCSPNTLAYTIPSQNVIANCPIYYSNLVALTRTCHGQDQATTTLHEFCHAPGVYSPGTVDNAYGYSASTALTSSQAVANADSYALYANALYVGC